MNDLTLNEKYPKMSRRFILIVSISRVDSFPDIYDFDYECRLPLDDDAVANLMSYMDDVSGVNDSSPLRSSFVTGEPDRWTCFVNDTARRRYFLSH